MSSYEQKKLVEAIVALDNVPQDPQAFAEWILAEAHLAFLRNNARSNDLVVFGSGEYSFIHSVAVPNKYLDPLDKEELVSWSSNPFTSIASYCTGGGRKDLWIDRSGGGVGTKSLREAVSLIYGRTFEGWSGSERNYFELSQEYAHLTEIHWRPEARAYCRFDENGDLESVVSVTMRGTSSDAGVVSFLWGPLEVYLAAADMSLVRMFDFTLLRRSDFKGWPGTKPEFFLDDDDLFYKRGVIPGYAAYTRGMQIIRPRRPAEEIFRRVTDRWFGRREENEGYVEFVAHDWRNQRITKISTDPAATTNYFEAKGNSLPFELSPAFFRPEVLTKYKADRDKYTVTAREITCRSAWHLKGIDVNEAGQVHAYICDLRHLPYAEQLHWLSFNEAPKANISERAVTNDFRGEWVQVPDPVTRMLIVVRRWRDRRTSWWTLRDERLLEQVNTPLTASRSEWSEAFMDVAKLVVEGFNTKVIRAALDDIKGPYDKNDGSIVLLEKLTQAQGGLEETSRFDGLRAAQLVRTKVKGHVAGSDADRLAQDVLVQHETFADHFRHICAQIAEELETIEGVFTPRDTSSG